MATILPSSPTQSSKPQQTINTASPSHESSVNPSALPSVPTITPSASPAVATQTPTASPSVTTRIPSHPSSIATHADNTVVNVSSAPNTSFTGKVGRRPKFTATDDLIIVREVAAVKAHIAPNGTTKERFSVAAHKANASKKLQSCVTWKSMQDRYKRLQTRFEESDRVEATMSGVGGEVGEMDELLSRMKEERDDLNTQKSAKRRQVEEREAQKARYGAVAREMASHRQHMRNDGAADDHPDVPVLDTDGTGSGTAHIEERPSSTEPTPRKKRRREQYQDPFEGDISLFTDMLKNGDEARSRMAERQLEWEKEKYEQEKQEREKEREERREVREEAAQLELAKFKLMMDTLSKR